MSFRNTPLTLSRRHVLALAAAPLVATPAMAQTSDWPKSMVKLVVPFPAGGPTDTAARIVGERLTERLKQSVVVDNRAGASGSIAAGQVMKAPGDGYTIMMLAAPTLLAPHLIKTSYNPTKDFAPVAMVYDLPIVIVVNPKSLPKVTDLPSLIQEAKANPSLNYTSSGTGSFGHVSMELLKQVAGFNMQHVPYKGSTPAITDTIGGQVPVMYADLVAAMPHIKAGKLRAIAVGSAKRVDVLPQVKTVAEQGFKDYVAESWGGLVAPLSTPKSVIDRLSSELKLILAEPATRTKMAGAGAYANYMAPAVFGQRIAQDFDKWGQVIRDKRIAAD